MAAGRGYAQGADAPPDRKTLVQPAVPHRMIRPFPFLLLPLLASAAERPRLLVLTDIGAGRDTEGSLKEGDGSPGRRQGRPSLRSP